jgi:Protein of unknown function (DUF2442)
VRKKLQATVPSAVSAHYDHERGRIIVALSNYLEIGFPPAYAEGLENASPSELENIEISPSGYGLHFPAVDGDLYLPTLLQGIFGSRRWMAGHFGQAGGALPQPQESRRLSPPRQTRRPASAAASKLFDKARSGSQTELTVTRLFRGRLPLRT